MSLFLSLVGTHLVSIESDGRFFALHAVHCQYNKESSLLLSKIRQAGLKKSTVCQCGVD